MIPNNGRPGDVRAFVHKRIIGAVVGGVGAAISGGNPITGAIGGFTRAGGSTTGDGARAFPVGLFPGSGAAFGCSPGFFKDRSGNCVPLFGTGRDKPGPLEFARRVIPGGQTGEFEFGEAVMGRFGAALEPGIRPSETRVCPRGTVLGVDGLCYNHRDIKNSERMWPRGRRPLLTGGDMRCISIAAAAAKKIEKKTKQLQSMGMLKKPASRSRQRALPAAHHAHVSHD